MRSLTRKRELKEKSRKIKSVLYWGLCVVIVIFVLIGARFNLINYWQTKNDNRRLKQNLERISQHNETLKIQINELKNNPEALERVAREKHGMQKKGERVIHFIDEAE